MGVTEEQPFVYKCPFLAVFNNFDLVEKILEEVTDDIRNNMDLRLVNRTFRDAYHANLRKTHRNLKIEYISWRAKDQDTQVITENRVYINYRRIPVLSVYSYLIFLKNIVKARIQSLVVKNLCYLRSSLRIFLHESIRLSLIKNGGDSLKKLIGMDETCHGNCEACVLIPKDCVEYGPLGIENLRKSFTKPRVFEKLIVPDYLLDDIANDCVESTQSKDDCFNAVRNLISSNISCKTLVLKISESREDWFDPDDIRRIWPALDYQVMPREVIEVMLKQWNVQSVVLKFVYKDHREEPAGRWTRTDWFTRLRFKDRLIHINLSDPSFKIKEVLVDLTDSFSCRRHLLFPRVCNIPGNTYVDIVPKVRRVFLNDRLKIQFPHHKDCCGISRAVEDMIGKMNVDVPRNFKIEINHYSDLKYDLIYLNNLSKQERQFRPAVFHDFHISELPNAISVSHKTINQKDNPSYTIRNEEWVGRCFQFSNMKRNWIINWTLFTNEDSLH
ncbi:unnamed protein product [Caenorhabditis brenneri]